MRVVIDSVFVINGLSVLKRRPVRTNIDNFSFTIVQEGNFIILPKMSAALTSRTVFYLFYITRITANIKNLRIT